MNELDEMRLTKLVEGELGKTLQNADQASAFGLTFMIGNAVSQLFAGGVPEAFIRSEFEKAIEVGRIIKRELERQAGT